MNRPKLWEFSILEHPTEDDAKKGVQSKILVDAQRFLAADEKTAQIIAARHIPEAAMAHLERLDIAIRPF